MYVLGSIGQSFLDRDYSVTMTSNAKFHHKQTSIITDGKKGKTYDFSQNKNDLSYRLGIGYYFSSYLVEIGANNSYACDEFYLSFGKVFMVHKRFLPTIKAITAVGYENANSTKPTSLSYGASVGFWSLLDSSFSLEFAFDYLKRNWSRFSHPYGDETWEDSQGFLRLGLIYFF